MPSCGSFGLLQHEHLWGQQMLQMRATLFCGAFGWKTQVMLADADPRRGYAVIQTCGLVKTPFMRTRSDKVEVESSQERLLDEDIVRQPQVLPFPAHERPRERESVSCDICETPTRSEGIVARDSCLTESRSSMRATKFVHLKCLPDICNTDTEVFTRCCR